MQLKWTPLYAAADAGHMKIVQYLIEERGCDSAVLAAVSSGLRAIPIRMSASVSLYVYYTIGV